MDIKHLVFLNYRSKEKTKSKIEYIFTLLSTMVLSKDPKPYHRGYEYHNFNKGLNGLPHYEFSFFPRVCDKIFFFSFFAKLIPLMRPQGQRGR